MTTLLTIRKAAWRYREERNNTAFSEEEEEEGKVGIGALEPWGQAGAVSQ